MKQRHPGTFSRSGFFSKISAAAFNPFQWLNAVFETPRFYGNIRLNNRCLGIKMKHLHWLAFLLFAITTAQAHAGERVTETVIVTASRIAESGRAVPQSMTVIDSDVLAKNQYESLANLLQNYGFQIMSYGPSQTSSQITIRGMDSNYSNPFDSNVLVLVNGVPIATTNLSMIPMDGIERIEILRGPGAVQYGSSAMGGVINVIPKRGGEEFHLSAEAGGGTWNTYRALGSLSGKLKPFDFAGAVTWNKQGDNYTTGAGKLYSDTMADGRLGYLLNFGINFNEENRLGVMALGDNDVGLGLNNSMYEEERHNGLGARTSRVNSTADVNYEGGYEPSGLSWKLRYFNAYDQYRTSYEDDNPLFQEDYTIETEQAGIQAQLSWQWQFLALSGGIDYAENEYSSGFAPRYSQKNTAAFSMVKLSFLEELLILTGGVRYEAYTFRVDGNQQDMDNTSLSAGIAINPADWLTVRSTVGESYKVPSGLYVVGYDSSYGAVEGNSDLKPEKGISWDAGFDIHYSGLKLGLTYFSTNYRDKITYEMQANGKMRYYNESGATYYNGLEGQLSLDLGEFFEWDFVLRPYFNFTRLFNYNTDEGERLYNVRDFVGSFGVNFNEPEWGLDVDVRANYIGYQKEQIWENNANKGDRRTGGKTTMDLFASQTVYDFEDGGKLSLKGEIRNLTNENYAYRYDYPMPGRSFYIGIRYDF